MLASDESAAFSLFSGFVSGGFGAAFGGVVVGEIVAGVFGAVVGGVATGDVVAGIFGSAIGGVPTGGFVSPRILFKIASTLGRFILLEISIALAIPTLMSSWLANFRRTVTSVSYASS